MSDGVISINTELGDCCAKCIYVETAPDSRKNFCNLHNRFVLSIMHCTDYSFASYTILKDEAWRSFDYHKVNTCSRCVSFNAIQSLCNNDMYNLPLVKIDHVCSLYKEKE